MNTIGKILVVLNLVFALAVAAFLVMTFAAGTNWRAAYEKLASEMKIADAVQKTNGQTQNDIFIKFKRADADVKDREQKLKDKEDELKAKETEFQNSLTAEKARADDANINAQKLLAANDRLKDENKDLTKLMQERDGRIIALQDENRKSTTAKNAAEALAKATQERNEGLLVQIQEHERKAALRDAGLGADNRLAADPNSPNPPSGKVRGKIEKINADDRNLVQVNVGTDQGVKVNHTLEVYRLTPTPLYLGMIRIRDAKEHTAVGRLMNVGINHGPLREGDLVANSVSTQQ